MRKNRLFVDPHRYLRTPNHYPPQKFLSAPLCAYGISSERHTSLNTSQLYPVTCHRSCAAVDKSLEYLRWVWLALAVYSTSSFMNKLVEKPTYHLTESSIIRQSPSWCRHSPGPPRNTIPDSVILGSCFLIFITTPKHSIVQYSAVRYYGRFLLFL